MRRRALAIAALLMALPPLALAVAKQPEAVPTLSAEQIVERHVAARGGAEAWGRVQTMVWIGHIESSHAPAGGMYFTLGQKRPNKTRFELRSPSQQGVRMFDGTHGWKLRTAGNGKPELQAYGAEELRFAQDAQGIDGWLIDHRAKGIAVVLEGLEPVEGRPAYRLRLTLPSGSMHRVWIDAETFLDIQFDRQSRNLAGQLGTVLVRQRDFREIEGLKLPFLIESAGADAESGKASDRMVLDRVIVNAALEDRLFAKPATPTHQRGMVTVTADPVAAPRTPAPQRSDAMPR
jgi:hypothetical protein